MGREAEPPQPTGQSIASSARAAAGRKRDVVRMVQEALRRRDVMLAYQPVVFAGRDNFPAFHEGLIRVREANGRIIPAGHFIDAVEPTATGRTIDALALELGLTALAADPSLRLSVNMSPRSIGNPRWMRTLENGLAADATVAERLILEITEGSAVRAPGRVAGFIRSLQARGIAFALDDFGAGATAFRYLRQFRFDFLKIDGQFIRGIHADADNQALTGALSSVARHFEMFTVAESVETEAEASFLYAAGIDCLQGHYYGAPTTATPRPLAADRLYA